MQVFRQLTEGETPPIVNRTHRALAFVDFQHTLAYRKNIPASVASAFHSAGT
jgi:hypothetical protein